MYPLKHSAPLPLPFVQFLHNHPGNFQRLRWRTRRRWGPVSNTASSGSHPAAACHTLPKDREKRRLIHDKSHYCLHFVYNGTYKKYRVFYHALAPFIQRPELKSAFLIFVSVFPPPSHISYTYAHT